MGNVNLPLDIRPKWFNPIRRLQSAASLNNGLAIVTISILIQNQDPLVWTAPRTVLIEPKAMQEDLLRLFSEQKGII